MSLTLRDPNQIVTSEHDEKNNAKRVIIVGGEMPEFKMPEFPKNLAEQTVKIEKVEVPVIVKEIEIQKIEVPIIIKEIEIKEIEKPIPVIFKELQIERVEVPIIVKEYETIQGPAQIREITKIEYMPKWAKILILAQAVISTLAILF